MDIVADLHIHSPYSRATSKDLQPDVLNLWAQRKGIQLVGTGDFTHPQWLHILEESLEPAEDGLFKLKDDIARDMNRRIPESCRGEVRFVLQTEISTIYKKAGKTRKVHHLILLPGFASVRKLIGRLERIGNLKSDGRPILGLDSHDLLETVLESDDRAIFIPAHIWTPWFSVFGSKSGFDHIRECYEELTPHIGALETGLSSDPAMNWLWSELDSFQLVSNSDAHSASKLGREANLLRIPLSYHELRSALNTGEGFLGTIEFYPEKGKYHLDGHRKCGTRMEPSETSSRHAICPVCQKPVTVGVMYRVEELSDRKPGETAPRSKPFSRLIPLDEVLGEVLQRGPATKGVQELLNRIVDKWGPELYILRELPLNLVEEAGMPLLAEALGRVRDGRIQVLGGFDGEYGTVHIFREGERAAIEGQKQFSLLGEKASKPKKKEEVNHSPIQQPALRESNGEPYNSMMRHADASSSLLNREQQEAVNHIGPTLVIAAGPGTGKTFTLIQRMAHLLQTGKASLEELLAVTFTNRAAREMKARLAKLLTSDEKALDSRVMTLHAFGHAILRKFGGNSDGPEMFFVADEDTRKEILSEVIEQKKGIIENVTPGDLLERVSLWRQTNVNGDPDKSPLASIAEAYVAKLRERGVIDYDDLLLLPIHMLDEREEVLQEVQRSTRFLFVDEHQDLNPLQINLLKKLFRQDAYITVIGDPDQSIYGFRSANPGHFFAVAKDFPGARVVRLEQNYRSTQTIVEAAQKVIERNPLPMPRTLVAKRERGAPIRVSSFESAKSEAIFIAHEINELLGGTSHWSMHRGGAGAMEGPQDLSFGDIAILYRLHALSGPLEEALATEGIPYQRYGERKLSGQKILSGVTAGLRWIADPSRGKDLLSFLKVPLAGVPPQVLEKLTQYAQQKPEGLWRCINEPDLMEELVPKQTLKLKTLSRSLQRTQMESLRDTVSRTVDRLLVTLGISIPEQQAAWDPGSEALRRFIFAAREWPGNLPSFLDEWSLSDEVDLYDSRSDRVTLLTVHAAKGLEFRVVFVAGLEESIFPHTPEEGTADIEEERRLFFVAMTRARDLLYLTRSASRVLWGKHHAEGPSRFLSEIPGKFVQDYKKHQPRPQRNVPRQLTLF